MDFKKLAKINAAGRLTVPKKRKPHRRGLGQRKRAATKAATLLNAHNKAVTRAKIGHKTLRDVRLKTAKPGVHLPGLFVPAFVDPGSKRLQHNVVFKGLPS